MSESEEGMEECLSDVDEVGPAAVVVAEADCPRHAAHVIRLHTVA